MIKIITITKPIMSECDIAIGIPKKDYVLTSCFIKDVHQFMAI